MRYVLFAMLLLTTALANAEEKKSKLEEFVDQGKWLPFQPAVPDNFVMKPMTPDGQVGLAEGLVWGPKNIIDDIWQQYKKNPEASFKNKEGIFRARFSNNVFQEKPGAAVTFNENDFQAQLKMMGAKEVTYRNVMWGDYPLSIAEVTFTKRKPLAIAWLGLNSGGMVVLIDYVFPDNQPSYEKDWEIWKKFICETKATSLEEIMSMIDDLEISASK